MVMFVLDIQLKYLQTLLFCDTEGDIIFILTTLYL